MKKEPPIIFKVPDTPNEITILGDQYGNVYKKSSDSWNYVCNPCKDKQILESDFTAWPNIVFQKKLTETIKNGKKTSYSYNTRIIYTKNNEEDTYKVTEDYTKQGKLLKRRVYRKNNKKHRIDKPAEIEFFTDQPNSVLEKKPNKVKSLTYFINGQFQVYKTGGPYYINYESENIKNYEVFGFDPTVLEIGSNIYRRSSVRVCYASDGTQIMIEMNVSDKKTKYVSLGTYKTRNNGRDRDKEITDWYQDLNLAVDEKGLPTNLLIMKKLQLGI